MLRGMQKQRMMRIGAAVVSLAISGGLVVWLIGRMELERVSAVAREADPWWLVLAACCTWCMPVGAAFRWHSVIRAQPRARLTMGMALRAQMLANVLNSVTPSKAGDMTKVLWLRRRGGLSVGVGALVVERLVDLATIGLLCLCGSAWIGFSWGCALGGGILAGVFVGFTCLLLFPVDRFPLPGRARRVAGEALQVARHWVGHPGAVAGAVAGSMLTWTSGGLVILSLASAVGQTGSMLYIYAAYPAAVLAGLVPMTVSGIGTRDAAFAALLGRVMPYEEAALIGLGYTVFVYWFLALGSLPFVAWEIPGVVRGLAEAKRKREPIETGSLE